MQGKCVKEIHNRFNDKDPMKAVESAHTANGQKENAMLHLQWRQGEVEGVKVVLCEYS